MLEFESNRPASPRGTNAECLMQLARDLEALQTRQRHHDDEYHPEIARLPVADRLNHIILHFAKYARKLMVEPDNAETFVTDSLIMSLSASNVIKLKLSDAVAAEAGAAHLNYENDRDAAFFQALVLGCGLMAEAREKLDHIEDYPFRQSIVSGITTIALACCRYAQSGDRNIHELVEGRLSRVRAKALG